MAQWHPITNLRNRLFHHPPVVVFFLCLLVLAGAFITIGLYSQNHEIKNPDINMDWNQLLSSLASVKFCTQLNNTEVFTEKKDMNSRPLLDHGDESIPNSSNTVEVVHVFLQVPLLHVEGYPDHNVISGTLYGSQLGLKGAASMQSLNVSLYFDLQTKTSTTDEEIAANTETKPLISISCLKITAPRHILPQTPSPPECPINEKLDKDMVPKTALAIESYMQSSSSSSCHSLEYTSDPKLTVLLTQDETALARYHLMLMSIVLLVLCVLICSCGSLTCCSLHRCLSNDPSFQKEALMRSS